MRVLLTGATGYFGQEVLTCLQRDGVPVTVVVRSTPDPALLQGQLCLQADLLSLTDWRGFMEAAQATHLIHTGWYTEYGKYWDSDMNLRWLESSIRLAQAFCETGGQHVLMAGTCAEYDWNHGYCREEATPLAPASLYGVAKDATRRTVSAICSLHGVPFAWGRLFYPYGPREAPQRLVPALIDILRGRRAAFGVNAHAYRDFLSVSDAANGFVALALQKAAGAFNVSSGEPVQIGELVRQIARILRADPQPVLNLASARPNDPPMLIGESLRLRALGWRPRIELEQGLEQMTKALLQSENSSTP